MSCRTRGRDNTHSHELTMFPIGGCSVDASEVDPHAAPSYDAATAPAYDARIHAPPRASRSSEPIIPWI